MSFSKSKGSKSKVEKNKSAKSVKNVSAATPPPVSTTTTCKSKAFAAPPETSNLLSKYVSKVKTKVKRLSTLKIKVKSKSRSLREQKSVGGGGSGTAASSSTSPAPTSGVQKSSKFALRIPVKSLTPNSAIYRNPESYHETAKLPFEPFIGPPLIIHHDDDLDAMTTVALEYIGRGPVLQTSGQQARQHAQTAIPSGNGVAESLEASAGASMLTQQEKLPPPRQESLGGSDLSSSDPEKQLP